MLHTSSKRIASYFVVNNIIGEDQAPVYAYGIELMLSTLLNTIVILSIGITLGKFFDTVVFMTSFAFVRSFAGGYHATTHLKCLLIFIASYLLNMGILSFLPDAHVLMVTVIASLLGSLFIYLYAPVEHKNKRFDEGEALQYKRKSRILAILLAFVACAGQLFIFKSGTLFLSISLGLLTAAISTAVAIKKEKKERA